MFKDENSPAYAAFTFQDRNNIEWPPFSPALNPVKTCLVVLVRAMCVQMAVQLIYRTESSFPSEWAKSDTNCMQKIR